MAAGVMMGSIGLNRARSMFERDDEMSTGIVKIACGTIPGPLAYFALALPAGYAAFRLEIDNWRPSVRDGFAMAVSYNGGASFVNDHTNFDSYLTRGVQTATDGSVPIQNFEDAFIDPCGYQDPAAPIGTNIALDFTPGDGANYPAFLSSASGQDVGPVLQWWFAATTTLYPNATVLPSFGRINLIRIAPYGNGDVNPPTSGHTFTIGEYTLRGILP